MFCGWEVALEMVSLLECGGSMMSGRLWSWEGWVFLSCVISQRFFLLAKLLFFDEMM